MDDKNSKLTARKGTVDAQLLIGLAFCGALLYKLPGWMKSYDDGYKTGRDDDGTFLARDFLNSPFSFRHGYSDGLKRMEKENGKICATKICSQITGFNDGYNVGYFHGGGVAARDFFKLPFLTRAGYIMGVSKSHR